MKRQSARRYERTDSVQSTTWETVRLGDFLTLKRGYDLSSSRRVTGPVPIISSSGITGYHNVAKVMGPGVVTGRYGTLGKVFFVKDDFWPLNTSLYVENFKGNNPRFTAYFLKQVLATTTGDNKAAVPGHNRNDLHGLSVRVTRDRGKQDAIASVLAAYDDLIENNRRRIRLLERAARMLYEEWFVRFRFPGHEGLNVTNGVPSGWETKPLSELASIIMGQSPKSIHYNEEGLGLPFHQGVTNFGQRFPSHRTWCTVTNRIALPGDILFSVRAPVGRINVTLDRIVIGRGIAAVRSNRGQQNFLFYTLKNRFFKDDLIGGGTIFSAVAKKDLHRVELVQPVDQVVNLFTGFMAPMDRQIASLQRAIDKLYLARDSMLPHLMNGQMTV